MRLKELMARLPADGQVRHEFRNFNLGMMGAVSPPSVRELSGRLGFDVAEVPMERWERGRLVRDTFSTSGFRIEVNEADGVLVKRWTVLHELIHAFLHRRDDVFAPANYRAGRGHFYLADELGEEKEANACVEALIFGDGALEAAFSLHGEDMVALRRRFGVSDAVIKKAMQRLR